MLHYDFENSVGYWICSTSHALRRALDAELARENITFRQWEVLAWIALEGELSQVELAERLGIEAPTLAGILSRMERDGWLERTACAKDRRRKLIRPTDKSEAIWTRAVECCNRIRERATQGLSPPDLMQLNETCERIRQNLASAGGTEPGGSLGATEPEICAAEKSPVEPELTKAE